MGKNAIGRTVTRKVGSGITTRTERSTSLDLTKPDEVEALALAFEDSNASLLTPWGGNEGWLDAVRVRLREITNAAPSPLDDLAGYNAIFRERETEGWYLKMIDVCRRHAESALTQGHATEAVQNAMMIGELVTELRFKLNWEAYALSGQKCHVAAATTRRGDQAARYAEVERLCAEGHSKKAAFATIAAAEGVTFGAIETDYYKARKRNRP